MDITWIVTAIILVAVVVGITITFLVINRRKEIIESENQISPQNGDAKITEEIVTQYKRELDLANATIQDLRKALSALKNQENGNSPNQKELSSTIQNYMNDTDGARRKISELEQLMAHVQQENAQFKSTITRQATDLEKLIKELKNVKDDLEDASDDLESIKKQKEKLSNDNRELNKERDRLQRESEQQVSDLQQKTDKLIEKEESIDFVNAILNAKDSDETNNTDEKSVSVQTGIIVDFVTNDVHELLKGSTNAEILKSMKKEIWQWANMQHKTWLKDKKVVALVGEFSAGKTSIVNRILTAEDKTATTLPVSSKATTAIPTYISYSNDFNSQFTTPDGKLKNIKKEVFEKTDKSILSQINISPLIQYFVVKYHNKNLEGISILDTPGFNSNDKEDAHRTAEVIKEADMLFWIFDVNMGEINKTSVETISQHLNGLPLYIVMSKCDTKPPGELEKLEQHVKKTMSENNIQVKGYIRFHQNEAISLLMNPINEIPKKDKADKIIFEVNKLLEEQLKECKEEVNNKEKEKMQSEQEMEAWFSGIEEQLLSIVDNSEDVKNMLEFKEPFFSSNYYKIQEYEYDEFQNKLNNISQSTEGIKEAAEQYALSLAQYNNSITKVNYTIWRRNETYKTQQKFRELIKNYNPKLLDGMKINEKIN